MKRLILICSLIVLGAASSGCTNPEVPAGHEGYIYYKPLIFGQMEYRNTLRGPATTGVSWRLYTENIDMRARSYTEEFKLLTKENLSVSFEVNTRVSLRPGSVQEIVEEWGGPKWYEWNVKERLRTIVREQVTQFSAVKIQLETPEVRAQIESKLQEKYMNPEAPTPIVIESVDIGEIHFPQEVAEAIERKIATRQELERQRFVLAKTYKDAAIKVLEAIRAAKQQLIISSTLDPLYVQQRAIQVYRKVAQSDNRTMIVLPNSPDGTALPLILNPTKRRILSESDKKRIGQQLDALEVKYGKTAGAAIPAVDGESTGGEAGDGAAGPAIPEPDGAAPSEASSDEAPAAAPASAPAPAP
jgi:regulator of protease activity HflC (stomatin/prohibitin superfamily)